MSYCALDFHHVTPTVEHKHDQQAYKQRWGSYFLKVTHYLLLLKSNLLQLYITQEIK